MTRLSDRRLAEKLTPDTRPEPPPELLARLMEEIPEELEAPFPATAPGPGRGLLPNRLWLAAASVVLVVGGGSLAWWMMRSAPSLSETAARPSTGTVRRIEVPATPLPPTRKGEIDQLQALGYLGGSAPAEANEPQAAAPAPPLSVGTGPTRQDADAEKTSASPPPPRKESLSPSAGEVGGQESEVEETITVTAESPLVDEQRRSGAQKSREETPTAPSYEPKWVGTAVVPFQGEVSRLEKQIQDLPRGQVEPAPHTSPSATTYRGGSPRVEEAPRPPYRRLPPTPLTPPPSTGGTAEPNDQPYGDVFFKSYGVNPFVDPEDDPLSTFGLDVDTASYTVVRRFLRDGHLPPEEAVRVEEMVNAFDYGDRPPRRGDFALSVEGAPSPWAPGPRYYLLRFAVTARTLDLEERPAAVLTFVVDVSGSMAREDRLGLVRRALDLLLDELGARDEVGLVVYGDRGRVLLRHTRDKEAIRRALGRLAPGGSTNAEEGLVLGYDLAAQAYRPDAANRVILCSDGVANVGRTGPGSILERIGKAARRGIELTTVGVGMGNYNDVLLEQLADRGDGRYVYVDTLEEARRVFGEELTGTLHTVAEEARAQVELDPRSVSRYRLLGYENRDVADRRFRDDTLDAGEVGAGDTVTVLYEVKLQPDASRRRPLAVLRLRYRPAGSDRFREAEMPVRLADLAGRWEAASRELRLSTLVARFAEVLRGAYWARGGDLDELFRRGQRLIPDFPGDRRVTELVDLIATARDLRRDRGGSPPGE